MDKREYKELSELAANGGTKAFARLYETVYREMYYTAFYTLCDDADAVELVTASARDGMTTVNKLRSEDAFRAFMFRNLCARIRTKLRESPVQPVPETADSTYALNSPDSATQNALWQACTSARSSSRTKYRFSPV